MREDPIGGEEVVLVVTVESDGEKQLSAVEERIESVGGTVTNRLQFGAFRVEITQERIEDLCALSGIESIETEHTVGMGGDAGEDL